MLKKLMHAVIGMTSLTVVGIAAAEVTTYPDAPYYSPAPIPVAVASPSYIPDEGFVLGVQGGYADTHWSNIDFGNYTVDDTGFAARVYAGFDFNRFFGFELGYAYLPKATDNFGNSISNYAFDLLAKLSIPVTRGLSLHAKAGGGYLHSSADVIVNPLTLATFTASTSHFGPAFGVGAAYEVIPNLAIGLDWLRYSGNGELFNGNYQPSPDAVFLGLSYKFPVTYT